MSRYNYRRRLSREVKVGNVGVGGGNPVRLQSMTDTPTADTEASAQCAAAIARAGGEIVRLTTQGEREAANMADISARLKEMGVDVPLVADVHFNPRAAYVAAGTSEKVRINPGNFVDPGRVYKKLEYTDAEYASELRKIDEALAPLLKTCRERGTALRLGVNHGSLSDRIMSRYGDTPEGMVESVMEFLGACERAGFREIVISIKASNVVVMVRTVRLLVAAMEKEGMNYPLHLGVTEAGDGEDGRIKSAVGIGTLLAEGLGDTIRVSLSEPPQNEIPVARALRDYICAREGHDPVVEPETVDCRPSREHAPALGNPFPVVGLDIEPEDDWKAVDASADPAAAPQAEVLTLTSSHRNAVGEMSSWLDRYYAAGGKSPVVLRLEYGDADADTVKLKAAADFGALLLNGYGSGMDLVAPALSREERDRTALSILQACRLRISKTEYIACPGCGRTLFDLPRTLRQVREATSHLKHLKIAVMGCVVNGPGEMADADYGYVGAGRGRVSIYKNRQLMVKNIPAQEALESLKRIIRENGDWRDPE